MTAQRKILVATDCQRELIGTGLLAAALQTDGRKCLVIRRPVADGQP